MSMQHHTTECATKAIERRIWGAEMNKYWMVGGVALAMFCAAPAKAQSVPVFGVTACGTPPTTITNGKPAYLTVLVGSGVLCSSASGGGGGGGTSSNFNSAFPAAGTAIGFSNGTNMVPGLVDGSGYLEVNVKTGGGLSVVDNTSFTYGTSTLTPVGGVYNSSITPLTSGNQGAAALTANRDLHIDAVAGTNLANLIASPVPLNVNTAATGWTGLSVGGGAQTGTIIAANIDNTSWAGTKLGAPSNYGTSPGAVAVPGVNANVTNTVATTLATAPALVASTANIGNVGGQINVTPTDCSGTITSGGTAQNAFSAQAALHGFTIVNLSTDPFWISFTTTAAVGAVQSYLLAAGSATVQGGSFSTPLGFGMNTALSVIAATTSDKYSCTRW